jgi:hypothetical protein
MEVWKKSKSLIKTKVPTFLLVFAKALRDTLALKRPFFVAQFHLKVKARNPQTFSDKIYYKMAHDHRPILGLVADKVAVREYVAGKVGDQYLIPLIGVARSIEELRNISLPREFVAKPTHASGGSLVVWEGVTRNFFPSQKIRYRWERFFVKPEDFDLSTFEIISSRWLRQSYYRNPGEFPEYAYKNIQPGVIIEELLQFNTKLPSDFRFFMFDGKCEFIIVDTLGEKGVERNVYSQDWVKFPVTLKYPNFEQLYPRPKALDEMLQISEKLSHGFDHIRVDLYLSDNGIKFGELTNYHGAGKQKFAPNTYNVLFGLKWKLPI